MHQFKNTVEAMVFLNDHRLMLNKQRKTGKISYQSISRDMGLDWDRISRLLNGTAEDADQPDNPFWIQCMADLMELEMTLRITRSGVILADSSANKAIGEAFKVLRALKGWSLGDAAFSLHLTKDALECLENGRLKTETSKRGTEKVVERYFSFDKLREWAAAMDGDVTIVLRPKQVAESDQQAA